MACVYNLKIGKSEEVIQIPSRISSDDEFNLEDFFLDLKRANPEIIKDIMQGIKDAQIEEKEAIKPLSDIDRKAAFEQVQIHLKRLGIPVYLKTQQEMELEGFPANAKAGVKNSEIYINLDQANVSSPMHEFLHLVFGVMKQENFEKFQKLMNKLLPIKEYMDIYQNLPIEYKNFMELDQQEEAFVRFFEELLNDKISFDVISNEYDYINTQLSEFISKTFDIPKIIDTLDFLKTPFAKLTGQGSELFIPNRTKTTGYLEKRNKIETSAKVMNYISDLIKQNIIEKGECK